MAHKILTAQRLRELLHYDPENGSFTWRVTQGRTAKAGGAAGCVNAHGYVVIRVLGRLLYAHRLAWMHVHGAWPDRKIDHRDGNKKNNWIDNLREATNSQNGQNRRYPNANSNSGVLGVHWDKSRGKWSAKLMLDGKTVHSSRHDTIDSAEAAYAEAKSRFHPFSTMPIADNRTADGRAQNRRVEVQITVPQASKRLERIVAGG